MTEAQIALARRVVAAPGWCVVSLATRADLLRLYLNINAGGTPHSPQEIERVRNLLALEEE